jgi:hypothetical protein
MSCLGGLAQSGLLPAAVSNADGDAGLVGKHLSDLEGDGVKAAWKPGVQVDQSSDLILVMDGHD